MRTVWSIDHSYVNFFSKSLGIAGLIIIIIIIIINNNNVRCHCAGAQTVPVGGVLYSKRCC